MRSEDKRAAAERLVAALFASFVLHALFFMLAPQVKAPDPLGPITDQPLSVVIAPPHGDPLPEVAPTAAVAAATPAPPRPQRPINRPPTPLAPRFPPPPLAVPSAAAKVPTPPEPAPPPAVDMMAAIEARRAQRRAAEAAMARGSPAVVPDPVERNLETLSGREGVGGVFQILRKSRLSGEFAFNGFRNEGQKRWREVIEVNTTPEIDIDTAIVRRMIDLIRTHYSGDFQWDSHRLGRVVVLSARPVDQPGLEEFLLKEFFGTPVVGPGH